MLPAFAPERNVLFMESYLLTEETGVSSEFNRVLILVWGLLDEGELAFRLLLEINECYAWLRTVVHVPIFCYYCCCNIQLFCTSEAQNPCRLVNIRMYSAERQNGCELIRLLKEETVSSSKIL
jgi:hypothetical protein